MKDIIIIRLLQIVQKFCSYIGIFTVNSACSLMFGQTEEHEALKKYKKIN